MVTVMIGDWIKPRVRLRSINSPETTQALLQGVTLRKRQREIAWVSDPTAMSQRLSTRSDRRPVPSDVSPQMHAAGNMISPAYWALKPRACCRKSAMMKFIAKLVKDSQIGRASCRERV